MALTDSNSHLPPTSGSLNYNTDIRPALGATYIDPVFDEVVRRLSNIGAVGGADDSYTHCLGNADNTLYIYREAAAINVRNFSDASIYQGSQPGGTNAFDLHCHPTDPDKYIFHTNTGAGRGLYERDLSSQVSTRINDFNPGVDLGSLGGTVNWCDKSGRWFVFRTSAGVGRVYDRTEDVVYTGDIAGIGTICDSGGWFGISPDGNYAIASRDGGNYTLSYALNHATNTVTTTGVKLCVVGSGHSAIVSASDGKNYIVVAEADITGDGVYKMDVTTDNSGATYAVDSLASQGGVKIISFNTFNRGIHITHGPVGAGQDWVFISTEENSVSGANSDDFNAIPGTDNTWVAFKQEIIAINVVTQAVRRLAHHRSRGIPNSGYANYYWQPRLSCSWNGGLVLWASNMNDSSPADYSDYYGILNPLGAAAANDNRSCIFLT